MILFTANGRCARCLTDEKITTGSVGLEVSFDLSADFDGLTAIAVFEADGETADVILTGSSCTVPAALLQTPFVPLRIGVYARDGAGTVAIPTVWAEAGVIRPGATPGTVDPTEPVPDWTAQVQKNATDALAKSEEAMETAEEALHKTDQALIDAERYATAAERSAELAADSSGEASISADAAWYHRTQAEAAATEAAGSATAAAGSATAAAGSAGEAAGSATAAAGSATAAAESAGEAAESAAAAAAAETRITTAYTKVRGDVDALQSAASMAANLAEGASWTERTGINYQTGATTSSTNLAASDFVDVSGIAILTYMRLQTTGTSSPSNGIAFYTDADAASFIAGSGTPSNYGGAAAGGGELYTVAVPQEAKYARFTWWRGDVETMPFAAYDGDAYSGQIDQVAAALRETVGYVNLYDQLTRAGTVESGIVAGTGKITIGSARASYQLENDGYAGITLTAGTEDAYVSFLAETIHGLSNGDPVVPAAGEPARHQISAGTTQTLRVPADCAYIVIMRYSTKSVEPAGGRLYTANSVIFNNGAPSGLPKLSILFVGNSLALDSVSYVPSVLSSLGVEAELTIGIMYLGGRSLRLHYKHWTNDEAVYRLYESVNLGPWQGALTNATGLDILTYREWDIISFQQASTRGGDYSTYQPYLANLIEFVDNHVDYKWKMAWNNVHSNAYDNPEAYDPDDPDDIDETEKGTIVPAAQAHAKAESNYVKVMAALEQVLADNPVEIVFPVATAAQLARRTSLNGLSYGYGEMMYDGKHAQEGIACQVEGYTVAIKLLELLGIRNKSVLNDDTVIDADFESYWNIPGQHGSPVGSAAGDTANRRIAQRCAILACQHQPIKDRVAELEDGLSELKSHFNALPFTESYNDVTISWTRTDKYYNKINGNEVSQNYYYQFSVPVVAGDKFILTGTNDYNKAIYATLNSNNTAVRYPSTGNSGTVSDIEITIESDETTLVLQSNANDRSTYKLKKASGIVLDDAVVGKNNLKPEVDALLPTTQFVNLFNPNDEGVVTGKYIDRSGVLHDESVFCVSGFIPIEQNVQYVFPVYANYFGTTNAVYIPYYNQEKTYVSFVTGTYDENTQLLTVKFTSGFAHYTRINFATVNSYLVNTLNHNPEVMMFTKAPYPSEFIPYGDQSYFADNVYLSEANMANGNPLFRKNAVFVGDSICNGGSAMDGLNGWAGRIGRKNQMLWKNFGISGATFTSGLSGSAGVISDQPIADPVYSGTPDYIIIEGGTNDADLIGSALDTPPAKFGSFTLGDYASDFDNTTYCGAIEKLFKNACNNAKQAKVGVIIAQKMGQLNANTSDYTAEHNNRRKYFETLIQLCDKWGIPYLNLWDGSILNPMLLNQYTYQQESSVGKYYTDGQHLTSEGYDYISPIIENWMRTL